MEELKKRIKDSLNKALIEKQGLSDGDVDAVVELHAQREQLFAEMTDVPVSEVEKLRAMAAKVTDIDFGLQEAWKFPRDERFHSWWFRAPHCSCPKFDNQDWIGTGRKILDSACPLHGEGAKVDGTQKEALALVEECFANED